jgi:hypothetical protein
MPHFLSTVSLGDVEFFLVLDWESVKSKCGFTEAVCAAYAVEFQRGKRRKA